MGTGLCRRVWRNWSAWRGVSVEDDAGPAHWCGAADADVSIAALGAGSRTAGPRPGVLLVSDGT